MHLSYAFFHDHYERNRSCITSTRLDGWLVCGAMSSKPFLRSVVETSRSTKEENVVPLDPTLLPDLDASLSEYMHGLEQDLDHLKGYLSKASLSFVFFLL